MPVSTYLYVLVCVCVCMYMHMCENLVNLCFVHNHACMCVDMNVFVCRIRSTT